ncbi:conserved Plasmodium protein, unknown function [Plasmodium ovale curtisi]|uniref:PPM-type phosphatase domain-containing protein n=1 Tax=Plasmodium ovale curtisi TaxID=864141 RepID=A0A1A8WTH0_PLAOA|nr:conserved Plasmodium protein, unknown function [Plasmodium ovale curtisi]
MNWEGETEEVSEAGDIPYQYEHQRHFNIFLRRNEVNNLHFPPIGHVQDNGIHFLREKTKYKNVRVKKVRVRHCANANGCYFSVRRKENFLVRFENICINVLRKKKTKHGREDENNSGMTSSTYLYSKRKSKRFTSKDYIQKEGKLTNWEIEGKLQGETIHEDKEKRKPQRGIHKSDYAEKNSEALKYYAPFYEEEVKRNPLGEEEKVVLQTSSDRYEDLNRREGNINLGDETNIHLKKRKKKKKHVRRSSRKDSIYGVSKMNNNHESADNTRNSPYISRTPMLQLLLGNFGRYANYEYIIPRKICYDCFLNRRKRKNNNLREKVCTMDEYVQMRKKKRRGRKKRGEKSFTFNYGFYSKKGSYHENEDTSSHAQYNTCHIRNEIAKFISNMKKKRKYNLLEEVLKLVSIHINEGYTTERISHCNYNSESSHEKNGRKLISQIVGISLENATKIYLNSVSPMYHLEGETGNYPHGDYDMICNYFYEETNDRSENVAKVLSAQSNKRKTRKKLKKKRNILKNTYTLNVTQYGMEKVQLLSQVLEHTQEEELYNTCSRKMRKIRKYSFVCKICKKCEQINDSTTMEVSYFDYLLRPPCRWKGKNKRRGKEIFYSPNNRSNHNCCGSCSSGCSCGKFACWSCGSGKGTVKSSISNFVSDMVEKDTNRACTGVEDTFAKENMERTFNPCGNTINCKMCMHMCKYDNLPNDYLLNSCKDIYDQKYPLFLNMSGKEIFFSTFLASCENNEWKVKNWLTKKEQWNNYPNWLGKKDKCRSFFPRSYSDLENYKKEKKLQKLRNALKNGAKQKHTFSTDGHELSIVEGSSNEKRENVPKHFNGNLKQKIKQCEDNRKRQLFEEFYKESGGDRDGKKDVPFENKPYTEMFKNGNRQFDMHFFTICDGHSDAHASLFLIKNAHRVFYYLLIRTLFNVHMALKLLHPLLDILYYHACAQEKRNNYSGACIVNVLLRENYIYVNNTGDSKCAVMTFNLENFERRMCEEGGEDRRREMTRKEKRQEKTKGKKKSRKVRERRKVGNSVSSISSSSSRSRCADSDYTGITQNWKTYVINVSSVSYNELNSEHNCNNYSEYLRMYKLYFYDHLKNGHSVSGKGENMMTKEVNMKKVTANKVTTISGIPLDAVLNDRVMKINEYIWGEEGKQVTVGNLPFGVVKLNRLDGCLHPSRVIGDYDLKRKYNGRMPILSSDSNLYKYDMNNINLFNNIHYVYKRRKCFECKREFVLSSYGKVPCISDIVLLPTRNHKLQGDGSGEKDTLCANSCCGNGNEKDEKKPLETLINIYREDPLIVEKDRKCGDNKIQVSNFFTKERFSPYINIKNISLNNNYIYQTERKHFFHLLVIASDGVFEYMNPLFLLNVVKKNKSIYEKIQKIYYTYNTYSNNCKKSKEMLNSLMHKYMFTKRECTKLARDIVKNTIKQGNFDDSSCFCVFLFPTLFIRDEAY